MTPVTSRKKEGGGGKGSDEQNLRERGGRERIGFDLPLLEGEGI